MTASHRRVLKTVEYLKALPGNQGSRVAVLLLETSFPKSGFHLRARLLFGNEHVLAVPLEDVACRIHS